jgi:hypothetical protein
VTTAFQSNAFQNNAFQADAVVASLVGIAGPWSPEKKRLTKVEERRRLQIEKARYGPRIERAVKESVAKAVEQRKESVTPSSTEVVIELAKFELQDQLLNARIEWIADYAVLLAKEYERVQVEAARREMENEDQQIIMLLFQM